MINALKYVQASGKVLLYLKKTTYNIFTANNFVFYFVCVHKQNKWFQYALIDCIFGYWLDDFRFNFVYFSYYCDSLPEYAQFHKQLQKQFHDKYVLKIHHVWQLSFFENPI